MIASAERILRENPARPGRESQLVQVVRDGRRAARLVDDLLFMARLDVGAAPVELVDRRARTDVGALAVAAAMALRLQRPDLDVRVEDGAGGTTVAGDPDELRRALTNVLDNAGAATPADGVVGVHTYVEAGRVTVAVSDSGPGVPESDRARIFDRFVRGDDARRATVPDWVCRSRAPSPVASAGTSSSRRADAAVHGSCSGYRPRRVWRWRATDSSR